MKFRIIYDKREPGNIFEYRYCAEVWRDDDPEALDVYWDKISWHQTKYGAKLACVRYKQGRKHNNEVLEEFEL